MSGERIQEAWENLGLQINSEYLSHLRFADDIVLLSESAKQLQKKSTTRKLRSMG